MKEENVYLKKLDRIARVSAFQKSNPEAHIEGAFTKYYKVIDITLTRILKPGILKFIINNFLSGIETILSVYSRSTVDRP